MHMYVTLALGFDEADLAYGLYSSPNIKNSNRGLVWVLVCWSPFYQLETSEATNLA